MAKLILASQSPRRQALLEQIGVKDYTILIPHADESYDPAWTPAEIVSHISRHKAQAAARLAEAGDIVITADTMVFLDQERLGKPHDQEEAFRMLSQLSGREHRVCTGVTVCQDGRYQTEVESTAVQFRTLTPAEIWTYIRTGEPMDKAGAYGIQGRGALLVEGIRGDYFNVMGLPVLRLARMLAHFGVDLLGKE